MGFQRVEQPFGRGVNEGDSVPLISSPDSEALPDDRSVLLCPGLTGRIIIPDRINITVTDIDQPITERLFFLRKESCRQWKKAGSLRS